MTQKRIFNDYSEAGYRVNIVGCRSSFIEDNNIVYNLRQRWPNELEGLSDVVLVNEYDQFAMSEMFGDNDARFLEWLEEGELIGKR
jgi:hypothetical protein